MYYLRTRSKASKVVYNLKRMGENCYDYSFGKHLYFS